MQMEKARLWEITSRWYYSTVKIRVTLEAEAER